MYCSVPTTTPVRVRCCPVVPPCCVPLAMPKSTIFTMSRPSFPRATMMLSGLRSRWMIPMSCAASSPSATWRVMCAARSMLDTPVGRLAIVISKDAWMIDVNDRFLAKGANVILQPEAFSDWAYAVDPWQPDIFKEGGFANLQKNVPFVANVDASMTGNFFDVTFDGQSAIIRRRGKTDPGPLSATN